MFSFSRLPELLVLLILQAASSIAQLNSLSINNSFSIDTSSLTSATSTFTLPRSSTSRLFISIALCDSESSDISDNARYFVTNNSAVSDPSSSSGENDVFEITVGRDGMGNFTLDGGSGGMFAVSSGGGQQILQVGVSDTEPLHNLLTSLPLLGDTTANQALLFSPPFLPTTFEEPTYPNYSLPVANLTAPDSPTQFPNFTLLVGPTSSFPEFNFTTNAFVDGSPVTACSLVSRANLTINTKSNPGGAQSSLVLRNSDGWRTQWLMGGLQPLTNYTAFVLQDDTKVSGPINFVTKSAFFSCPIVHSLPYCPLISYAVPLPPPPPGTETYDSSTLPESISGPLISYMSNFTTSLSTFACGRDWYSSIVGCSDCQAAYRTWLCSVQLPRCGESPPITTTSASATSTAASLKMLKFWKRDESEQTPLVAPALMSQNGSTTPRNSNLPNFPGGNWTELLPCLEACNAVERACPPFLEFACPVPRFNAAESYGVGFVDGDVSNPGGVWIERGGSTGKAQDRWGNVWCNGPGLGG